MPLRKTRTSVLVLHTLQQGGIAHLAAGYISRTPYLLLLLNSILSLEHSNAAEPGGLAAIVCPKCGGHFRYDPSEPVKRSLQHPDHSF